MINIAQRKIYECEISDASSQQNETTAAQNLTAEGGHWCSAKSAQSRNEHIILDFHKIVCANFIQMLPALHGTDNFPLSFRIEISDDKSAWKVIYTENNFILNDNNLTVHMPPTSFRFLKLFITQHAKKDTHYFTELGRLGAGVSGVAAISASSESGEQHRVACLLDTYPNTCWESRPAESSQREELSIDVGYITNISRISLTSSHNDAASFPRNFNIAASSENRIWTTIIDHKNFSAEKSCEYHFSFHAMPARFIKIEMDTAKGESGKFIAKIAGLKIFSPESTDTHAHLFTESPGYASIFEPGLVRFAKDGEDTRFAAISASDRRLRDATTFFKGIVQFAEDGESTAHMAVMADDSRLQPASELSAGIVRLSFDNESKPGTTVQANDSRLKEATEKSPGIVRICPDSYPSELGVVRGSDTRLKPATENSFGIMRLAKNGEDASGCVVQANDKRLKDATEKSKGIVAFALDGESENGKAVQANDKRLKDATVSRKGIVELAEDGETTLGTVVQANDRRLRDATVSQKGIVELAEDGETKAGAVVQSNDRRLRDAAENIKGIVALAPDGDTTPAKAVQANDRRLRDATIIAKGIMQFATDGESAELKAVQASDKRLRDATSAWKGIVELAENGETTPGTVVQANDHRLRDASVEYKGIVQLAHSNEIAAGKAVQANDERLRNASTEFRGIVQLAKNGESSPLKAVQSDDERLREASTQHKGIVQFAADGQSDADMAVQASDTRLAKAGTVNYGITRFAQNGESAPLLAVQADDERLAPASETNRGSVLLARHNDEREMAAVQSNDPRLSNARPPLPHTHEYAPLHHELSSHVGRLTIEGEAAEAFSGITPPPQNGAMIHAKNTSGKEGSVGIAAIALSKDGHEQSYGLVAHSDFIALKAQTPGREGDTKGCALLGISRFSPAGVFSSEHDWSLVVEGNGDLSAYDPSAKLQGDGKALYSKGNSLFYGKATFSAPAHRLNTHNIAELFEIGASDVITPGDIVVASAEGNSKLVRSIKAYDTTVIGVITAEPVIELSNTSAQTKLYALALAGKVYCKVDARQQPIKPGDLIVSSDTPGCGMKGTIDSFDKIGSVIGKALEGLDSGTGVIAVFICHS